MEMVEVIVQVHVPRRRSITEKHDEVVPQVEHVQVLQHLQIRQQ